MAMRGREKEREFEHGKRDYCCEITFSKHQTSRHIEPVAIIVLWKWVERENGECVVREVSFVDWNNIIASRENLITHYWAENRHWFEVMWRKFPFFNFIFQINTIYLYKTFLNSKIIPNLTWYWLVFVFYCLRERYWNRFIKSMTN